MIKFVKHRLIKFLEKVPYLQIFIYNNLHLFKFLFPHDKDYYALKLIFSKSERRIFLDVGGNIGLSSIGFRELGFKKNKLFIFEPDTFLCEKYLERLKRYYNKIYIYRFGLSTKNEDKFLYQAYYNNLFLHFNNSFSLKYVKKKIKENYPRKYKVFKYKKKKFQLKRFDNLSIDKNICFVKIDVEGFDHLVLKGMKKLISLQKPVFLIEYNISNFKIIYDLLKSKYFCYIFMFEQNKLIKLNEIKIKKLSNNKSLDLKYSKNSFNIFFIPKMLNI